MMHSTEELRILVQCAPTMLRMLEDREKRIIQKLYGEFRGGRTDHITTISEFACVRDQINEINAALRQADNIKGEAT